MSQSDNIFYRLFTDRERLRVVLFSLFAFCILVVSLTFFALNIGKPYMGTVLSMNDRGWAVESVDPNGLASQGWTMEMAVNRIASPSAPSARYLYGLTKSSSLNNIFRRLVQAGQVSLQLGMTRPHLSQRSFLSPG